ncbi:hypothetical protein C8R47DRAFT_1232599 [Mycena vitilis]|nr:hypothetical protein C8R47DRAFT_1232599 [Mycena vitilis]
MRVVSFFIALSLLPTWLALDNSQKSSAEIVSVPGINDKINHCIDVCVASVVTATQTALAAYNNTAGNTPTTDATNWQNELPNTDGFPPFSVLSTTAGSGSTSSGGSPNPTRPASPTQSGHRNGAGVFSTGPCWFATLGAAVVFVIQLNVTELLVHIIHDLWIVSHNMQRAAETVDDEKYF